MKTSTMKKLRDDKSGAVAVEFAAAVMPLFITFFSFWQLGALYTADLAVRHGANIVVRAAVVIKQPNNPGAYVGTDSTGLTGPFARAFDLGLKPWTTSGLPPALILKSVKIDYAGGDNYNDNFNMTTAKVEAIYNCSVPLGKKIVCGSFFGLASFKILKADVTLPHNGARYKL